MRYLLLLCCAGLLFGQGSDPKPAADAYDVSAHTKDLTIGAAFMVHSYSLGEQMYVVPDYLVVEVAIYPPKGGTFEVHDSDFTLRINGRKEALLATPPTEVVALEKHSEWNPAGPGAAAGACAGSHCVNLGAPPTAGPYPGQPVPGTGLPPRVEIPRDNAGVEKQPVHPDELLVETSLVEGTHHTAISGFLFFPYRGRMSAIKTLELLYGDAILKLR
jgi:hypothetical protein